MKRALDITALAIILSVAAFGMSGSVGAQPTDPALVQDTAQVRLQSADITPDGQISMLSVSVPGGFTPAIPS